MDYISYTIEDFALDESFQKFVLETDDNATRFWKDWIEKHPQKKAEILKAAEICKSLTFAEVALPESKIESAVIRINKELARRKEINGSKSTRIKIHWPIYAVAATITLLLASTFLFKHLTENEDLSEKPAISYVSKTVPNGRKLTIALADSTVVKLNSGTTFKYPETFSGSLREVFLEGEAFFQVTKNKEKPFIIHSGNVDTRVLGTSFNVTAYDSEDDVKVAVVTGKISVNLASDTSKTEILTPNQMFVFNKKNQTTFKSENISLDEILAWKDARIVFSRSSHDQIIEKLRRWYGVEFEVNNELKVGQGYTAQFKPNESLEKVLEFMQYTLKFNYKIEENKVILY